MFTNITGKSIKIVCVVYACMHGLSFTMFAWGTLSSDLVNISSENTYTPPPSFPQISTWINIHIQRNKEMNEKNERVCVGGGEMF